jgi:HEAT repeats
MSPLEIVLTVIALELVTLLCLFAGLLVMHVRRSGTRVRRLRRLWTRMFPEALEGRRQPTERIKATLVSDANFKTFHCFLDERLLQMGGDSPLQLRHLCRALGATKRLQSQLADSRDPLERAAAAKTLGRLRERMSREAVTELLHSSDPAVVLAAGYASASFRDPNYFLPVLRAVYKGTRITLHGTAELLSRFQEGVCPVIHSLLDKLIDRCAETEPLHSLDPDTEVDPGDQAAQVVMVDLLAFFAYRPASSTLLRLLQLSEHDEVLIHIVKALAKIGDAAAIPDLSELLTHPNWVLRGQAVQALAALEAVEAVPLIRTLLEDEDVRVRLYARNALECLSQAEPWPAWEDAPREEAYA